MFNFRTGTQTHEHSTDQDVTVFVRVDPDWGAHEVILVIVKHQFALGPFPDMA